MGVTTEGSYENVVARYLDIVKCYHKLENSKKALANLDSAQVFLIADWLPDSAISKNLVVYYSTERVFGRRK